MHRKGLWSYGESSMSYDALLVMDGGCWGITEDCPSSIDTLREGLLGASGAIADYYPEDLENLLVPMEFFE